MSIHDLARKYISEGKGLKLSDSEKKVIFEFCDWLLGEIRKITPKGGNLG